MTVYLLRVGSCLHPKGKFSLLLVDVNSQWAVFWGGLTFKVDTRSVDGSNLSFGIQVLLLDADSQPLINPEAFFETDAFREHGNLLWSDFWAEGFSEVGLMLNGATL